MANFDTLDALLVSSVDTAFGDDVTWVSQQLGVAPYDLRAVVDIGQKVEGQARGYFAVLTNIARSDLDAALNGSTDLNALLGDTVQVNTPDWAIGTYRVQSVSDAARDGTVIVEVRKPRQLP